MLSISLEYIPERRLKGKLCRILQNPHASSRTAASAPEWGSAVPTLEVNSMLCRFFSSCLSTQLRACTKHTWWLKSWFFKFIAPQIKQRKIKSNESACCMLDAKISKTILVSLKNQSAQVQVSHENLSILLKATSLHLTVGHLVKFSEAGHQILLNSLQASPHVENNNIKKIEGTSMFEHEHR